MKSVRLTLGLGLAALAAMSSPSLAADIVTKAPRAAPVEYVAPYSWSGAYVGVNGGWVNQQKDVSIYGLDNVGNLAIANAIVPTGLSTGGNGWLGGATLGYNWQFGHVVAGAEFDLDYTSLK